MKIHGQSHRLEKQLEEQRAQIERLESELNFFKKELATIQDSDEDSKEVINKIATSILGKSDYLEIAWELVNIIPRYLNCVDCIFYLVDHEDQELSQIAAYGEKIYNGEITNHLTIPLGKGIVGTVAKTAIPELIHDTSQDERYIADLEENYSEITVPILFDGKVIGVLDCEAPPKNFFNVKQLSTLINVAGLIGLQLNNVLNLIRTRLPHQTIDLIVQFIFYSLFSKY